ncbi:hypothetical protein L1987_15094 [Smallanthus sonchifolius]|uniref:Uncharacterized protein n=1 Tax=Smallanthus sonchifolius TaxID=185202 RepID=A0ACB9J849_9ASTR|nr:hypothetical protein L1987_15094 [Smallanthus sonchifolius]
MESYIEKNDKRMERAEAELKQQRKSNLLQTKTTISQIYALKLNHLQQKTKPSREAPEIFRTSIDNNCDRVSVELDTTHEGMKDTIYFEQHLRFTGYFGLGVKREE